MMLVGAGKEDIIPFLFGGGGTGKSTFIYVILRTFGGYGYQGTFRSVVKGARASGAASPDLWAWRGRRFVALDEIEEGQKLGAVAKSLTGDEIVTMRGLYLEEQDVPITWTLLGQGNKEPEADPSDAGLQRRIYEIPFDTRLEKPKGARDYKQILTQPDVLAGVMQWVLEGHRMWREEGLGTCPEVEAAKVAYWGRQDVVGDWIDECCARGPGLASDRNVLWGSFDEWQQDRLHPTERLSRRKFDARLKDHVGTPKRVKEKGKWVQKVSGIEVIPGSGSPAVPGQVPGSIH
jgi:putative DNA primase/helicase